MRDCHTTQEPQVSWQRTIPMWSLATKSLIVRTDGFLDRLQAIKAKQVEQTSLAHDCANEPSHEHLHPRFSVGKRHFVLPSHVGRLHK